MNKIKNCLIILALLMMSICVVSAATVIDKQLVSDGGWFGEKIYKVTYDDGSIVYQVNRALFLSIVNPDAKTTIQGYKIYQDGSLTPATISTIKISYTEFGTSNEVSYNTNPYLAQQIPSGAYVITSSVPNGYTVAYSVGVNTDTFNFVNGNTVTIVAPDGGYVNLWWKYIPVTITVPTPTSTPVLTPVITPGGTIYTAIQGYKLDVNNAVINVGTISIVGNGFNNVYTTNPYSTGLINAGTYTITSDTPTGYTVSNSQSISTLSIYDTFESGNTMTINAQSGKAYNVWFKYTKVIDKPKPTIIQPALSRIWDSLVMWLSSWFPLLSITGGSSVNVPINQPYSTTMSLAFGVPDTVYSDGSYTAKFGQWIVIDSNKNLKYESGWTNELVSSPYTVTASYTPTSAGKYFLVGLINKQTYTWNGAQWVMSEVIETKEVQELVVGLPNVPVTKPIGVSVYLNDLFGWLKGLFSWLPW